MVVLRNTYTKNNGMLPAATLVEVMVAMVLVMLAFGFGVMTFLSVSNSNRTGIELEADLALQRVLFESEQRNSWFNETVEMEHLRIEKSVVPYMETDDPLQLVTLTAWSEDNKLIREHKTLILVP